MQDSWKKSKTRLAWVEVRRIFQRSITSTVRAEPYAFVKE
uniref:Uncharacterized protein n=1 Tax=Utricularia reniformis TaxID=192314 RepID=A0A1Y0B3V3_9LAMI|nr:hypothetical protein AEK19_MT1937 [Utricularia reniformis]ART32102.1 hypothetical protein AEK19_MT1937 [Utricularia reniformis]